MRFTIEYPTVSHDYDPRFLQPGEMANFVRVVEDIGADAIAFTEHPAPSAKWLRSGGHESLDPLTALAFCAAITTRLRLMTFLLVLPLHNPLLIAKQIATADLLSGGRVIITAGSGYLRSEFAALGVDFEERNELFDEALDVLCKIWPAVPFEYRGRHFTALGQASRPTPVQRPRPPVWIGGNSRAARSRAARHGDGWSPLITRADVSHTARTRLISGLPDLHAAIDALREEATSVGRDPMAIEVQVKWGSAIGVDSPADAAIELLHRLHAIGVTWVVLSPPSDDIDRCVDVLQTYGRDVISVSHDDN